jgi:two-component system, cell cycle sensor histidine kinase and response regulator CckA
MNMADKPTYEALEQRVRQLEQLEIRHKRAEEALKASEAKLYEAQKLAGLGYWSWDIRSGKVTWSEEVYKIFGQNPSDFSTTIESILALSPWPEDQDRGNELIKKAMENHEKGEYDQKFLFPDGKVGYYHSTFQGIYNDQGELVAITGTVMDITERKQAEEALRQSEERYRSLVEHTMDGYFIFELPSGRLIFLNQRMCDIFQYAMPEALARTIWDLIDPEHHDLIRKRIRDGSSETKPRFNSYSLDAICRDGRKIRAEVSISIVRYQGNPVVQGVLRDVTKREKLQRQLEQAQKMESVGRLAGGVAHDFNNMLSVILGRAEMLLLETNAEDPQYCSLQEIHSAAIRSSELTRQLLAYARQQTIAPKVLDLNENIGLTLRMLKRIIGEDVQLSWNPAGGLWPVRIDPTQIDQILINLCLNARDSISRTGKITIETSNAEIDEAYCIGHMEFRPGTWVQLTVSDDGCGIDKERQAFIFEPFFTTKGVGKGTGLGLATVYGIVKQNHGFIYVYSEPGLGTTFKIYLPRAREPVAEDATPVAPTYPEGIETVLIVEDEASILDLAKTVLERFGYTVLTAPTPREALEIAECFEDPIQLLITDVVMPEMNGKALKARMDKIKPRIKVLFMSGYTSNIIVHRGVLEANVNFLQKPFSIESLSKKVREVLDQ